MAVFGCVDRPVQPPLGRIGMDATLEAMLVLKALNRPLGQRQSETYQILLIHSDHGDARLA